VIKIERPPCQVASCGDELLLHLHMTRKKHTPFAGIILIRFEGCISACFCGKASTPGAIFIRNPLPQKTKTFYIIVQTQWKEVHVTMLLLVEKL
jgi:hypothetical protein